VSGEPLRGFDRAAAEYEARMPDERLERRGEEEGECSEDFACRCPVCVAEYGDDLGEVSP
jgi:hypothetical protein